VHLGGAGDIPLKQVLFFSFLSCISAVVVVPFVIHFSEKKKWLDMPDGKRKVHVKPVPHLGGIALFLAFFLAVFFLSLLGYFSFPFYLLAGGGVIFLTGLIDDLLFLPPWGKLIGQTLGALILIAGGVTIQFFTLPWDTMIYLGNWGYPLTLLWIVGITNALNLIDGMDGLSAGIGAIASFTLGIIAWQEGRIEPAVLSFLLTGATVGFLFYNFPPAKIFLGDSGALFLGGMLATISVQGAVKSAATFTLAIPILILGVPILDTFFAIIRRSKNHLPVSSADRGHLHHRLLERGYSPRRVVVLFYIISIFLGVIAIIVNTFVRNGTYSLLLLLLLFALFWRWGKSLGVFDIPEGKKTVEKS